MKLEIVRASETRKETFWLSLSVSVLFLVCAVLISQKRKPDDNREAQDARISAFSQLNGLEQGTYNDLLTAAEEIEMLHEDSGETLWPSVDLLEKELIPPFVKDNAWEARGSLVWIQRVVDGASHGRVCAYAGSSSASSVSGSFLLLLFDGHEDEKKIRILYLSKTAAGFPVSLEPSSLTVEGWREVVPYLGEKELRRLKG